MKWKCLIAFALLLQAGITLLLFISLSERRAEEESMLGFQSTQNQNALCRQQRPVTVTSYATFEEMDSPNNDLFFASTSSVDDLKRICSALESCHGFNSQGWLKTAITQKAASPGGQLYVKQVSIVEEGPAELPEAGFFEHYLQEYKSMINSLQIYIHSTDIGSHLPSLEDYKYGVEQLFIDLLTASSFVTTDWHAAHLFFVPLRCTAYRKSVKELSEGVALAQDMARSMMDEVKKANPTLWNTTLGRDHFYICAHDMGARVMRDVPEWRNMVALVNTASTEAGSYFIPHKDVSLPNHPGRGSVSWDNVGRGSPGFKERKQLAFFAGNTHRGRVRPQLFQFFNGLPEVHLVEGYMSDEEYRGNLHNSKFCLCPRGNEVWSPRLIESLWFGCVPVIIADHYALPFDTFIDWKKAAVVVPESDIVKLLGILRDVPDVQWTRMQFYGKKVSHHLTWHNPPRPFDAFYSVLFQLWRKSKHRTTNMDKSHQ